MADLVALEHDVESATQRIGRELWNRLQRRQPSIFNSRWWLDHVLEWAMEDESVKVQMFRFVDVLPMLKTHDQVTRHLDEYFEEVQSHLPWAVRLVVGVSQPNTLLGKALAITARANARSMGARFIAGEKVDEVLKSVSKLRRQGLAFTLDLLGEAVISEPEAEQYQQQYLRLIEGLAPIVNAWPEDAHLDRDEHGWIPRVNVSLKLSALYSRFRPMDPVGTAEGVKSRLRPILRAAREKDAYVHIDMEHYAYKDLTLDIFKQVFMEDEFRDYPDCGIVIQTYMPEAGRDLQELLEWTKQRETPIWVRLVKGAYWDYETVSAKSHGWPIPVYQHKCESDANFERQTRFLMEHHRWLRPAIASHNMRGLAHSIAWAEQLKLPPSAWEIQMLYGMADNQAHLLTERGHRVRIYSPFGELIPGMAYLVRRLLENTSNDSFLRHSYDRNVRIEDLFMNPSEAVDQLESTPEQEWIGFMNEPHSDFSKADVREKMQAALDEVEGQLGQEYSLVIGGKAYDTRATIGSINPSNKKQLVGRVASARVEQAALAIEAARQAWKDWSRTPASERIQLIETVANELRGRRYELAAWEVFECGKPWAEADADVAEAIDFCMYYAQEMRRLSEPQSADVPGEENSYFYRPRGVAVVIAPWNFPLAILCGMTVAAVVTGNTVIMKPAEQSSVVAAKFMEVLQTAGIPDGVVNYLPGVGEDVGPALVGSADVDLVAFTGSRAVGLAINQQASNTSTEQKSVKRVIAEMGGKNAIIIDDDADLDEAVQGVIASAFGYAGQKCSACSRVIVLKTVYQAFINRLKQAAESYEIGPADAPGSYMGPVIDDEAFQRIQNYIAIGRDECETILARDVGPLQKQGFFIGPHIFANVDPESRLAQHEIFGPVLAVIPVDNLSEALSVANNTEYALTGGIYSRSPKNLARVRQEFAVGNLYLNRPITGALVHRHPFGGYKMSGIGTKAGGPDYLLQFLIPVSVSENTMRRGFAPASDKDAEESSKSPDQD